MKYAVLLLVLGIISCGPGHEVRSILCTVTQDSTDTATVSCPDGTSALVTAPSPSPSPEPSPTPREHGHGKGLKGVV